MSLTALDSTPTHQLTTMFSEGSQTAALTKSSAALKMYLSYLGLLRKVKVLLSNQMYQFIYVLILLLSASRKEGQRQQGLLEKGWMAREVRVFLGWKNVYNIGFVRFLNIIKTQFLKAASAYLYAQTNTLIYGILWQQAIFLCLILLIYRVGMQGYPQRCGLLVQGFLLLPKEYIFNNRLLKYFKKHSVFERLANI